MIYCFLTEASFSPQSLPTVPSATFLKHTPSNFLILLLPHVVNMQPKETDIRAQSGVLGSILNSTRPVSEKPNYFLTHCILASVNLKKKKKKV